MKRAGLAAHALAALALIPAFARASRRRRDWDQPLLLAVLLALATAPICHDVPLPSGISFDATAALALIAVALAGPLPALAVIFLPIAVNALCGRERLLRAGNLANLAAYGWYTLAGALLLHAFAPDPTAPQALAWLFVAGLLQVLVNWAVGPAVYGTLWLGHPLRALVEMLRDALPAGAAMAALGALTVVLYGLVRPAVALALFALVAVLPQSALTFVARTRPVALARPAHRDAAATRTRWPCTSASAARARRELGRGDPARARARRRRRPGRAPRLHGRRLERGLVRRRARHRVVERRRRAGRRARRDHPAVGPHRRGRAHLGGADRRREPAARPPRSARASRRRGRRAARPDVVRAARAVSRRSACRPRYRRPSRACTACACPHGCGAHSPRASSAAARPPRRTRALPGRRRAPAAALARSRSRASRCGSRPAAAWRPESRGSSRHGESCSRRRGSRRTRSPGPLMVARDYRWAGRRIVGEDAVFLARWRSRPEVRARGDAVAARAPPGWTRRSSRRSAARAARASPRCSAPCARHDPARHRDEVHERGGDHERVEDLVEAVRARPQVRPLRRVDGRAERVQRAARRRAARTARRRRCSPAPAARRPRPSPPRGRRRPAASAARRSTRCSGSRRPARPPRRRRARRSAASRRARAGRSACRRRR